MIGVLTKAFNAGRPAWRLFPVSSKAWAAMPSAKLPRYYFDLPREKKNAGEGGILLDPRDVSHSWTSPKCVEITSTR